jgi:hypothetical protein
MHLAAALGLVTGLIIELSTGLFDGLLQVGDIAPIGADGRVVVVDQTPVGSLGVG